MKINHIKLREAFGRFWKSKKHKELPPISLVPKDDPTTLFTGSGMQQLVPYLLGQSHPLGKRLYNIQRCFRAQDIEEVGDNRHTTFFEMMGNWSLGDYFKKEQLAWFWGFLTKEIGLPQARLYVTVFEGDKSIPRDEESALIWRKLGVPSEKIFFYPADKNWWSRAGKPEDMPPGEPGGPDSEVFFEFTQVNHDKKFGAYCHPNCDCGRFLEIGNSVFMEYRKNPDGSFSKLTKKSVDFGGGLERILAAIEDDPDIFKTELYQPLVKNTIGVYSRSKVSLMRKYSVEDYLLSQLKKTRSKVETGQLIGSVRVIVDHLKAASFLINDGVLPSNKEQGYVLRRLIRRAAVKMRQLKGDLDSSDYFTRITNAVIDIYKNIYFKEEDKKVVSDVISAEINRFSKSLERGLREIDKIKEINGEIAFNLYQSFGFPLEITEELFLEKGQIVNREEFRAAFERHRQLSRKSSKAKFKGGLVDKQEQTIKYHTATHLVHQALFDLLGESVKQHGSNITSQRLRFDFYSLRAPSEKDLKRVEKTVNQKIKESLPVFFKVMNKEEAVKIGAKAFFREKYGDKVKVYFIGKEDSPEKAYSKEFCGGPHVKNTSHIGRIRIYKLKRIGNNIYRIYAR